MKVIEPGMIVSRKMPFDQNRNQPLKRWVQKAWNQNRNWNELINYHLLKYRPICELLKYNLNSTLLFVCLPANVSLDIYWLGRTITTAGNPGPSKSFTDQVITACTRTLLRDFFCFNLGTGIICMAINFNLVFRIRTRDTGDLIQYLDTGSQQQALLSQLYIPHRNISRFSLWVLSWSQDSLFGCWDHVY